jgi:hypothetical protein
LPIAATIHQAGDLDLRSALAGAAGRKLDGNRHQLSHDVGDQLGHDYNARERLFIRVRPRGAQAACQNGR